MTRGSPFTRRDLSSLPVNFWLVGQEVSLVQRRGRYMAASTRHPGKMLPLLARRLVEEYTAPGDWILDPLSGIGTTGVEAIHLGRHYVGIELEPRWARLQRENLALAARQGATGRFDVVTADARCLAPDAAFSVPEAGRLEPGRVDAVITSPPYGDRLKSVRAPSRPLQRLIAAGRFRRDVIPENYGGSLGNLGNLPDTEYLAGMRQVYAGCHAVLKPGGLLIAVIRPGRDRRRLRPLHHETARLCVALGFEFLDERVAILARVVALPGEEPAVHAHALFFKRLAVAHLREAGHPVSLEQLEYVLVFRKPTGEGAQENATTHKSGPSAALAGSGALRARKEDLGPEVPPEGPEVPAPIHLHPNRMRQPAQMPCRG